MAISFLSADNQRVSDNRAALSPRATDYVLAAVLPANTQVRLALPSDARVVSFSGGADFYAKFGNSSVVAAVPGASVTDGSASVLNPATRSLAPAQATHVSLISASATVVTVEVWS